MQKTEPNVIEMSTPGNDPDGYSRARYDYGKLASQHDTEGIVSDFSIPASMFRGRSDFSGHGVTNGG